MTESCGYGVFYAHHLLFGYNLDFTFLFGNWILLQLYLISLILTHQLGWGRQIGAVLVKYEFSVYSFEIVCEKGKSGVSFKIFVEVWLSFCGLPLLVLLLPLMII